MYDRLRRMIPIRSAIVTGATGFIGSALCKRLAREGVRTFALVRSVRRPRVPGLITGGVDVMERSSLDVSWLAELFSTISPDVVFHLAADGVSPTDRDPQALVDGNLGLLARLLLATHAAGIPRFVHTGSCHEYGGSTSCNATIVPLCENDPLSPLSTYGAAKAGSVLFANAFAQTHGLAVFALRLFGVYGPDESPSRLIPYLVNCLRRDEIAELTNGEQIRDLLHVDDVVEAYLSAVHSPRSSLAGVYNVCSGRAVSVREVAEAVANALGKSKKLLGFGRRPLRCDEAHTIVGNPGRLMAATNWRPSLSLTDGINCTVEEIQMRTSLAAAA